IGTAKPSPEQLEACPHRLIDIADPADSYSAGRFVEDARREIESILSHGRLPVLAGGTMLYFRVLQNGIASLPSADPELRAAIDREASDLGWPALHQQLVEIDPIAAQRIDPNDGQRIQRALEVFRLTGTPISRIREESAPVETPWRYIKIGLWPGEREALHQRIEKRLHHMLDNGLIDEVAGLRERADLNPDLSSMRAVGYRQIWGYLDGNFDLEEATRRALVATRQLAKRQLTWMRHEADLNCIEVPASSLEATCLDYLQGQLRDTGTATRRLC
ncbi:MAG: tRNA (adenosine(37)-N6)-dimethylallyltransferase MiaA, partial [Gammaproteobacteria bacterium]